MMANMSRFGDPIRERRERLGTDGSELAKECVELEQRDNVAFQRFSQQTFSRWEKDRTGEIIGAFNPRRLRTLAYLLRWSADDMLEKVGVSPGFVPGFASNKPTRPQSHGDYVEVPLSRPAHVYVAGTGPAWDPDEILGTLLSPSDLYPGKELIGLKAMSGSLEPYHPKNAVAIIVHDDGMVKPGDFCGIRMSDDGVVVKRFVQELDGGVLLLESLNPGDGEGRLFTALMGRRIIGKVVRRVPED